MTVAEDVTTMAEAQAADLVEKEKASAEKEKVLAAVFEVTGIQLQEVADSVREVQLREKAVLAEEANQEAPQLQNAKADFHLNAHQEDRKRQDRKALQREHHDVLKAHLTRQEKEGQEKANTYC